MVRRIQRKAPESLVVITGCYAQLKPKEIAEIPGVDLVLGAAEKFNIAQHIRELAKGDSAKICSCDIEDVTGFHSSYSLAAIITVLFVLFPWLAAKVAVIPLPM